MTTSSLQSIQAGSGAAARIADRLGQTALAFWSADLPAFEVLAVIISAALITGAIIIIIKTEWLSLRVDRVRDVILKTDMPKRRVNDEWAAVQKHFFAGNANDLKVAIMQADNILNVALQYAGVRGVNLGERLKNLKRDQMPNLEDVWAAHKLRNEIAHETGFSLKRDAAERALETYEAALKNLGAFEEGK